MTLCSKRRLKAKQDGDKCEQYTCSHCNSKRNATKGDKPVAGQFLSKDMSLVAKSHAVDTRNNYH